MKHSWCDSVCSGEDVVLLCVQLQDKATLLTAERKKRGKTIPEGLASAEDIRGYHQVASHVVRCYGRLYTLNHFNDRQV